MRTPWAILLCKFRDDGNPTNGDDSSEPLTREQYTRFFAPASSGSRNVAEYFRDCSLGTLDLAGTEVFGWYTLDLTRGEYTARVTADREGGRGELVDAAREKARAAGVDLDGYTGVVVCLNVATDLFGSGGRVVCDTNSLDVMLLGHEMGHGYGLQHSRIDGSADDYRDRWDIMSAANVFSTAHPSNGQMGPLMNAANVRSRGWLPESRVWRGDGAGFDTTLQLRSLSRYREPGMLAAELPGGLLVELRTKEGWDAGIPRSAVMVHRYEGGRSYVLRDSAGVEDMVPGASMQTGDPVSDRYVIHVGVDSLDEAAGLATVRVRCTPTPTPSLGAFYRGPGDWLVWRAFDERRWHGEEVFDNRHAFSSVVTSQPSVVTGWRGHRFAVFFRGADGTLRWKAFVGGRWHGDAAVGGGSALTSDPCIAQESRAGLAAFYRTSEDALAWRSYDGMRWHGEEVFGAGHAYPTFMSSAPSAVANWAGHQFAVFFRGADGRLRWKAHHGGRWHGDALVDGGGELSSAPCVVPFGSGDLGVFYRGPGDTLVWRAHSGGRWHAEERFDGRHTVPTYMGSAPSVITGWQGALFAVFFRGTDGRLRWKAHDGGRWHADAVVDGGGALVSGPAVAAYSSRW